MGKLARRLILLLVLTGLGVGVGVYMHLKVREADGRASSAEIEAKVREAQRRASPAPPDEELRQPTAVVDALLALSEIRAMAKDAPDEAVRRLRALVEKAPDSPEASEARIILADLLAKGGDVPGALAFLDAVIAEPNAGPRATRARIERARLHAKTDPAAARRELEAILGDDQHLPALQLQARLELGLLDIQGGEFLRAIATLTPLTQRNYAEKAPALEAIRRAIEGHADRLAKGNDPAAILAWGDEMIRIFPQLDAMRSTLRYHQAAALRQSGRLSDARILAERLRRDDPALEPACTAELERITEAEAAAGILRGPAAFLKAKAEGREARAHLDGDIAADATWTPDKGPLVLTAQVTVKPGVTLTIEPGCVVQFLLGARLVVQGTLIARGTAEAPVRFTSAVEKSPTPFDGDGVLFADSSADDRCVLEHCLVEYQRVGVACAAASPTLRHCVLARNGNAALHVTDGAGPRIEAPCRIEHNDALGIRADGAVVAVRRCLVLSNGGDGIRLTNRSKGTIEGCRIRDNGGHGIACDNFASPTIQANEIAANQGCGIRCNRFSQPAIQGNVIRENQGSGIRCSLDSASTIAGNLIEANGDHPIILEKSDGLIKGNTIVRNRPYGLNCLASASPQIEDNWIEGNGRCGIICGEASSPVITRNAILGQAKAISTSSTLAVQARDNYFGEVDDARVEALIFDKGDEQTLGEVVWKPRLPSAPPRPAAPSLDLP
ncbi:MAG TPA: right-handed parallel beta-helix repeat-containing protein [Planctomycetota bacterium]|nr:right-handed parallel beta-helix repeat-containing protein [Planctomycetota bacterium]